MRSHPIFMGISQSRNGQKELTRLLTQSAHQWDHRVKHALKLLGDEIWQDSRLMGLIPLHQFRLRQKQLSKAWVWWIEHDIPPYDRFRCAAYKVELHLNENEEPVLVIQTAEGNHTIAGGDLNNFENILAGVEFEAPLLIYRDFGPAIE